MILAKPNCPKCGESASHIIEVVETQSPIKIVNGIAAHAEEDMTTIVWDTSRPVTEGAASLFCDSCNTFWESEAKGKL